MPVLIQGVDDSIKRTLLTTIGDIIYASAVSTPARLGLGAALQGLRVNAGATGLEYAAAAAGAMTVLKALSGTSVTTAAHNMDTVAISGLLGTDRLLVMLSLEQVTQAAASAGFEIQNSTDATALATSIFGGTLLGISETGYAVYLISQYQSAATAIAAIGMRQNIPNGVTLDFRNPNVTTAWTGSWTLAYRSPGQTSGGTQRWSWSVYKLASS